MIDMDVMVILDRSGSMQDRRADHEGGVRSFIEDQRTLPGDVRFTLVQFDTTDPCEIVYDRVPLADVGPVMLVPRGGTPLLDAIGKGVAHLRAQQAKAPATQTVIMIVTDGEENSSREWTKDRVTALIDEIGKLGMQTLFLGAGIDAFAEAGGMGFAMTNTMASPNTPASLNAAYMINSDKVKMARSMSAAGMSVGAIAQAYNYTAEERATVTSGGAFTPNASGTFTPPPTTTTNAAAILETTETADDKE